MLETRVRELDGVAVREWGEPGAPTAVFWHALGPLASGAFGRELAPALVERGWRLLALDAPGFGRTPAREPDAYALDSLSDVLLNLLDEPAALIGHSWGGAVALNAAARQPELVNALVLLDTGHFDFQDLPDADPDASLEELTEQSQARLVYVSDWEAFVELLLLTATEPPESRAESDEAARRLLAAIPDAEWLEVEGSGHHLLADAGPQVAELVAAWLDA